MLLAEAAISIIFHDKTHLLSQQKYACRNKTIFVTTKVLHDSVI